MGCSCKNDLFTVVPRIAYLQAGSSWLTMDLPWGPTGVAICYDTCASRRYIRALAEGALLVLIIAEWSNMNASTGARSLRVKAIENQM